MSLAMDDGMGVFSDWFNPDPGIIADPSIANGGNVGDIVFQDPGMAAPGVLAADGLQSGDQLTASPSDQMFGDFGPQGNVIDDLSSVGDRGGGFITGETAPPVSGAYFPSSAPPTNVSGQTPIGGDYQSISGAGAAIVGALAGGGNTISRALGLGDLFGTPSTTRRATTSAAQQQKTLMLIGLAVLGGYLLLKKR